VALCLSGGGYRATLFHLGAVRRLHEVGLLERVDAVSSVSGGSIFAGVLADLAIERGLEGGLALGDYEPFAERVRAVTTHDLRTGPFLRHVAWNWLEPRPRVNAFERLLAEHVSGRRLEELPHAPRFVFCATDVTHGASWEFARDRVGSYRAGQLRGGTAWPLARAVAASACFPPVFGPLPVGTAAVFRGGRIRRRVGGAGEPAPRVVLSDGGVYDNLGLEPVWKTHDTLFVSDGGATFDYQASSNPVRRLLRYTSVATSQVRALRFRMLYQRLRAGEVQGATWSLRVPADDGALGYSDALREGAIEQIRTDLDRFTAAEQQILENHGYCVAAARLADARLSGLTLPPAPPPRPPHPDLMDEQVAAAALKDSSRRLVPARLLGRMR
jgi:NTE family protein